MQKQKWISQEDVQIITRNVNEILSLHITLLKKLEACLQNFHWENIYNRYCQLADVFVTMVCHRCLTRTLSNTTKHLFT